MKLFLLLMPFALALSSCYQVHSDDDLRTVPVTNNPHNLSDMSNKSSLPSFGY